MLQTAEHYYMAGDLTALPAISAMVEVMPAHALGHIALLVPHQDDVQDLSLPAGVACAGSWAIRNRPRPWWRISPPSLWSLRRSYFWFAGKRAWSCRCAATSDAPWMPSASGLRSPLLAQRQG